MQTAGTVGEKGGVFSRDAHIEDSLVFSKIGGNGQHRRPGNRGKRGSRPLNSPKAQEKFSRRLEFTSRQLEKRPRRLGLAESVSSQKDSPCPASCPFTVPSLPLFVGSVRQCRRSLRGERHRRRVRCAPPRQRPHALPLRRRQGSQYKNAARCMKREAGSQLASDFIDISVNSGRGRERKMSLT